MPFWSGEINPKTGRPFDEAGFNERLSYIQSKYSGTVDALTSSLEKEFPNMNREKARAQVAQMMATMKDPPSNPDEVKGWARNEFYPTFNRQITDRTNQRLADEGLVEWGKTPGGGNGWVQKAGVTSDQISKRTDELNAENTDTWGDTRIGSGFYGEEEGKATRVGLEAQGVEDASPGTFTGKDKSGPNDPSARLAAYYAALNDPRTQSQLQNMAANAARRQSAARGIQGGLSDAGVAYQTANAGRQYQQGVNAQALQYMGMDNQVQMNADALQQQASMFNAQQMGAAAQQAYQRNAMMGGTIGGIIGTGVGAIAQVAGVPGGTQIGGAVGTGIGSMAGGGAAPGAYTVKGVGSLSRGGRSGSGNNGGNV